MAVAIPSFVSILLALALLFGFGAESALPDCSAYDIQYNYEADYTVSGLPGKLSANLSLDHGTPTLRFSGAGVSLLLQNGVLSLPGALDEESGRAAGELIQYALDGSLRQDVQALLPYLSDALSHNGYTLRTSQVTEESGRPLQRAEIDTTPLRLVGAVQRWMLLRAGNENMLAAIRDSRLAQLSCVKKAVGDSLSDAVSRMLYQGGVALTQTLNDGAYPSAAVVAAIPIHLTWDTYRDAVVAGSLQIGDPNEKATGVWIEMSFRIGERGQDSAAFLTVQQEGKELIAASAQWAQGKIVVDGKWNIASGSMGDVSLHYQETRTGPVFDLNVAVYGQYASPSLTLAYADRELTFQYLPNNRYSYYYYDGYVPDDDSDVSAPFPVTSGLNFIQGTLAWDDNSYTLRARNDSYEVRGEGTYERSSGAFRQAGDIQVIPLTAYRSDPVVIHVEQDFSFSSSLFRLSQRLEAGAQGVPAAFTYQDSHTLTIR